MVALSLLLCLFYGYFRLVETKGKAPNQISSELGLTNENNLEMETTPLLSTA